MDDRKKDQSIQSHANFDGDSATGDRTQIRQDQQNQQPPQIDPSLADAQAVAASLGVDPNTGLSQAEAERRLAQYGPNELASAPPVPKWKKFLAQFKDPLVYLLLAATGISLIAWFIEKANAAPGAEGGEILPFDAIVIVLILIVNAVLGYIQESKAEEAVEALSQMTAPQTNVLRDGKIARINTVDVVPGDMVVLGEGDSIPADGRLLAAASLRVAEASLTGESVPVGKNVDTLAEAKALGDRANMVFNGTSVTQGTGRAIVTSTGMRTQVGKIADLLQATDDDDSPLQKEMNYVSKILGIAVCIIAAVVLVALALTEGFNDIHDVIDSLLLSVSLAVAAVPEGLAAILTVVLALGVRRMAEHHAIVKKLHSVETLGSASVICSDKTGTLTRNEMTVERVVTPSGEVQLTGTGYAPEGRMIAIPDAGSVWFRRFRRTGRSRRHARRGLAGQRRRTARKHRCRRWFRCFRHNVGSRRRPDRSVAYRRRTQGEGRSQIRQLHAHRRDSIHLRPQTHGRRRAGQRRCRASHRLRQGCPRRTARLLQPHRGQRCRTTDDARRSPADPRRRGTPVRRSVSYAGPGVPATRHRVACRMCRVWRSTPPAMWSI